MDGHHHEDGEWRNGLCSHVCGGDCGTCWGAWCCSCFLFGRASERMNKFPDMNKDHFSLFNADCAILFFASYCHLGWVPILLKRQEMRQKFGIRGDGCQDCLISYFCACCTLSQMDMEMKDRARTAQQSGTIGYSQQQPNMMYQPQGKN